MNNYFRIFRHSITMVKRTKRSYLSLSVTIVLSFSLLLGYLLLIDSEIYNKYKHIFQINRGYIKITEGLGTAAGFDTLLEKASEMENTCFYTVHHCFPFMSDGQFVTDTEQNLSARQIRVNFLSGYVWEYYYFFDEPYSIQWLDNKEHEYVDLKQGEAILDIGTYYALNLDEMDEPVYTFRFTAADSFCLELSVKIVGLIDLNESFFAETETGMEYNDDYTPLVLVSMAGLTEKDISILNPSCYAVFYSESPETLYRLAAELGFTISLSDSAYRWQDSVREIIQTEKSTKALITCAMLLILGINLYSSFNNALNERKFEIGVKRAIGASSSAIVRQFLYESLVVMVINILLSILVVMDIGLVYRLVVQNTTGLADLHYKTYTLYISPHSIGMFFTCSVTLTVVFSLIFAYKSTQVQVIDYLKAE